MGKQCRKKTNDGSGFCSHHLNYSKQISRSNKNAIFHEACFGNNLKLLRQCLTNLPLTNEQIDIELRQVITQGFRDETAYALLLSPKYFVNPVILASNLDNIYIKKVISFFLHKRFLIRQYLEFHVIILPELIDIIPRILDPQLI